MKRITAIFFCALLACMNAQAQRKVKLKVLEKGTEQPVIAATVVYADNEALQNLQGSVTNVDGLAELKIPSKKMYYYKISYVGFVPATGKIETTETEKTVYLEEDPFGTERGGRHRFTYCATHQDVARHDASPWAASSWSKPDTATCNRHCSRKLPV